MTYTGHESPFAIGMKYTRLANEAKVKDGAGVMQIGSSSRPISSLTISSPDTDHLCRFIVWPLKAHLAASPPSSKDTKSGNVQTTTSANQ